MGALAAGCRFFAGYPISPSSEIAEYMARQLPRVGGVFIQMEDEMASLGAVLGAALGGKKSHDRNIRAGIFLNAGEPGLCLSG